jgi:DNA-binding transcriptional regulator GbsR (MarR family)
MKKYFVSADEYYPIFEITTAENFNPEIEITEEDYLKFKKNWDEFFQWQEKIRNQTKYDQRNF